MSSSSSVRLSGCFLLTQVTDSSCTADTMDVLLNVRREVKVDDVFHVRDIQTSSSHLQ